MTKKTEKHFDIICFSGDKQRVEWVQEVFQMRSRSDLIRKALEFFFKVTEHLTFGEDDLILRNRSGVFERSYGTFTPHVDFLTLWRGHDLHIDAAVSNKMTWRIRHDTLKFQFGNEQYFVYYVVFEFALPLFYHHGKDFYDGYRLCLTKHNYEVPEHFTGPFLEV